MVIGILHVVGYILMAYIGLIIWLAEARGGTFWARLKYFLGNFTWHFWVLVVSAVLCVAVV